MRKSVAHVLRKMKTLHEAVLERPDPEGAGGWQGAFFGIFRVLVAVVRDIFEGQLTLRAMSLVYTTLLSLVPLIAISFSVLKGFGVHNQVEPMLLGLLEPLGADVLGDRRARARPLDEDLRCQIHALPMIASSFHGLAHSPPRHCSVTW